MSTKESTFELRRFWINPFSRIERIIKKRNSKKRERELQLKLAIFSGGITRMK
jgi:hypothetical protein